MNLSEMAMRMKECPNAGGDSVESEVMSLELFHRCFGAKLLKTEMEIEYFPRGGSIVDYTCEMFGVSLGVSVTRAMKYKGEFEKEDAEDLLRKKLRGIDCATQNAKDTWSKKILHIWATSPDVAEKLTREYKKLREDESSSHLTSEVVIMVTVVNDTFFCHLKAVKCSLGAKLLQTEMEIEYFPRGGSIVDYTCVTFGVSLGLSVPRAMKNKGEKEDAKDLLRKKLRGECHVEFRS
ncbi:AAC-rich mRNA clone AAC4 protein-like [Diadema setosum]|uniref:AAC-rich mRNA clone AAC4 protein-like n=1 Tax=Diadema setosum TaxID=31175 RepID=UPI003B3AA332